MDIRELLVRGRGPMVEFMPEPSAEALAETIVAFANGVGGTIIIGMDPQGHVHGDAVDDAEPLYERALGMCL
ncbi:MAG: ATP-binding protein, partial [Anaerolineae bacterium]|nr:ATP-binding protein [Anaerolineae bacterium]